MLRLFWGRHTAQLMRVIALFFYYLADFGICVKLQQLRHCDAVVAI
jgi:hypothetical protein